MRSFYISLPMEITTVIVLLMMTLSSHKVVQLIEGGSPSAPSQLTLTNDPLIANATNTSSPILRSKDGSYSWQFVAYQNNHSRLLVVLSTAFNTTIIWIANRNHPVSPDASLLLQMPSRSLVLRDVNGSIAWSSPVADIHDVIMNSTGNLFMQDAHNAIIWQSFDNPSDVLVPGQTVRTNHSLISRLSLEDVSEGRYTLKVEPGGAVLYASFDWQQNKVPYALVMYAEDAGTTLYFGTLGRALQSACNRTILIYKEGGTGVGLLQEGSTLTPQCRAEVGNVADDAHGVDFGTRLGNPAFRFLRLMPSGDIDTFVSAESGVALDNEFFGDMLSSYCKLPSYCGVNSLCSLRDNCTCPTMFQYIDPSNKRLGCTLIEALDCRISSQHQFLTLTGVDYYANGYLPPHYVSGPEECKNLCCVNCSCTAAFFSNTSRKCHIYDQVQTMQPGADAASITAFLRVAKLPKTDQPSHIIPKKVIVGGTTSVAVVLVSLVLLVVWIGRRVMNKPDEESDLEEEAFLESLPGLPPRFSYKDLHSATEGFSNKLGAGGSGAVYEGYILPVDAHRNNKLKNGMTMVKELLIKVAVKELQLSQLATIAASGKKQFRAEVATLGSLSHVNLVQLRGFCAEGRHRLLIYEFLENGSLDRWIFNRQIAGAGSTSTLTWEARYRIAVDTARGLAFLHEGSRDKIVHLDVKPQNILLDKNFRAKLADFGLCKLVDREAAAGGGAGQSQTVTAMRGTPGYMAPEWFLNLPVTDRSDVFSYGMVLLELVGGRKNLNLAAGSEDEWYFPAWAVQQAENGRLLDVIDRGLIVADEDASSSPMCAAMTRLLHVAFWCIQENVGSRPSMGTVLLMLEEHLQVPDPPLDRTYILRRQSRPIPIFNSTSTSTTSSNSVRSSAPASGIVSEAQPR